MSQQLWKKADDSTPFDPLVKRSKPPDYDPDPDATLNAPPSQGGQSGNTNRKMTEMRARIAAGQAGAGLTTKQRTSRGFGGGPVRKGT